MYRQINQAANISIEQNTNTVPNDGKYYILQGNNTIASFRNLKAAQLKYTELIDAMNLPVVSKKPSKVNHEHMMNEFYLDKSNNAIFSTSFGKKDRRTGRFNKSK